MIAHSKLANLFIDMLITQSSFVYIDVIVGFNQTEFTVNEDVGEIQLCLVMMVPAPGAVFSRVFPASVETRDGTAKGTFRTLHPSTCTENPNMACS